MSRYVTWGQVFKSGQVTPFVGIQVVNSTTGVGYPTQIDKKATYADGTVRHALITADFGSINTNIPYTIRASDYSLSGTAPTISQAIGAGFQATVSITISGTVYTADLQTLLQTTTPIAWMSGPLASEWIVQGPIKTSGGTAHPQLTVQFCARYYAAGEGKVDIIVESCKTFTSGRSDINYSVTLAIGGSTVYTNNNLTHYTGARYCISGAWNTTINKYPRQSGTYVMDSKAFTRQQPNLSITDATLNALRKSWNPMQPGDFVDWDDTGDSPPQGHIGAASRWEAAWLSSNGDRRAYTATILNSYSLGSFSIHFRDENTGYPVSINSYPNISYQNGSGSNNVSAGGTSSYGTSNPNHWEIRGTEPDSHGPNCCYLAYLITGDYYHLEGLQFLANFYNLWRSPGTRQNASCIVEGNQPRSIAWHIRDHARNDFICPDNHPLKTYWAPKVTNNINYWTNKANNSNNLGFVRTSYDNFPDAVAPWMNDFITYALHYATELGFSVATTLRDWTFKCVMGRMGQLSGDTGFCYIESSNYNIAIGSGSTMDSSWTAVYARNWSNLLSYTCGSSQMGSAIGLSAGTLVNSNQVAAYYPQYTRMALAAAVDAGYPNALTAWNLYYNAPGRLTDINAALDPRYTTYPRSL